MRQTLSSPHLLQKPKLLVAKENRVLHPSAAIAVRPEFGVKCVFDKPIAYLVLVSKLTHESAYSFFIYSVVNVPSENRAENICRSEFGIPSHYIQLSAAATNGCCGQHMLITLAFLALSRTGA
jgi:hypothetical protein